MDGVYRLGVGIVILNPTQGIFVGQRRDQVAEAWQMPQGGIEEGEDPHLAFWRELKEEVGLDSHHVHVLAESREWLTYDLPPHLQKTLWGGKFKGQRQKWYLCEFLGSDSDIDIAHSLPAEFKEWRWADPATLTQLIVPFKRDLYRKVLEEFQDYLFSSPVLHKKGPS